MATPVPARPGDIESMPPELIEVPCIVGRAVDGREESDGGDESHDKNNQCNEDDDDRSEEEGFNLTG